VKGLREERSSEDRVLGTSAPSSDGSQSATKPTRRTRTCCRKGARPAAAKVAGFQSARTEPLVLPGTVMRLVALFMLKVSACAMRTHERLPARVRRKSYMMPVARCVTLMLLWFPRISVPELQSECPSGRHVSSSTVAHEQFVRHSKCRDSCAYPGDRERDHQLKCLQC
jgi:hypothetical protein